MPEVEVRRSRRRRRTVSAYRDGDRVIVLLPARMSRAEEREWVNVMLERLAAQERRRRPSDQTLLARARTLVRRYLAELPDDAAPTSVRWVTNQGSRWGSCTPADRTVRLSSRLQGMPRWVIDYVLLHELAHLIEPGHTERFWSLVGRYPRTERARGYLEGVAATADLPLSDLADATESDGTHEGDASTGSDEPTGSEKEARAKDAADDGVRGVQRSDLEDFDDPRPNTDAGGFRRTIDGLEGAGEAGDVGSAESRGAGSGRVGRRAAQEPTRAAARERGPETGTARPTGQRRARSTGKWPARTTGQNPAQARGENAPKRAGKSSGKAAGTDTGTGTGTRGRRPAGKRNVTTEPARPDEGPTAAELPLFD